VVKFEDLSFEKQMAVARSADVLIGVHGNGLTHALLMRPHRAVVEIFPTKEFRPSYYLLSRAMGHTYLCIYDGKPTVPHSFFYTLLGEGRTPVASSTATLAQAAFHAIIGSVLEAREILLDSEVMTVSGPFIA
jgi:hypothetical protein